MSTDDVRKWFNDIKMFYINKKMLFNWLGFIIFKFIFDFTYVFIIVKDFAYDGFYLYFRPLEYIISCLAVIILTIPAIYLCNDNKYSSTILVLFTLLYFIPVCTLYGLSDVNNLFFLCAIIYFSLLIFFQHIFPTVVFCKPDKKICSKIFLVLSIISVIFAMYISWKYTGFRFTLDAINVYDIRAEAALYSMSTLEKYMTAIIPKLVPILLLYNLSAKKYSLAVILIIAELLLFSIAAHKSIFFFLVITLACYIFAKIAKIYNTIYFFSFFVIPILFEKYFFQTLYLVGLIYCRVLLLPAFLSVHYYELFNEYGADLFRSGILGKLNFYSIYSQKISFIIGEKHYLPTTDAVNGLLGDAFIQLGFAGIVIMPAVIIICLKLFDACTYNLEGKFVFATCVYYAIVFSNASWSTVLLTHGFLAICLLYYFFPVNEGDI